MKKMKQTLLASAVALSAFAGFVVPAAHAEVAASVGASNMYYWRGFDLQGGAALIADVNVSGNGFVAGAWTSSGDNVLGTEYDLYGGYSFTSDSFSVGVSVISYNYANPKGFYENGDGDIVVWEPVNPGDYVEVAPFIGFGPFKLTYYDAINADHDYFSEDYGYVTAELNFEKFAFKLGQHQHSGDDNWDGLTHLDATYKYNDKLSFTLGKMVENNDWAADEINFVVNLSLPIM